MRPAKGKGDYFFISVQSHQTSNPETSVTEAIQVNGNRGIKVVTRKNKSGDETIKEHPLTPREILNIKNREFMPRLFQGPDEGATKGPGQANKKTRVSLKRHKKSITRKAK